MYSLVHLLVISGCLVLAAILTGLVRRHALRSGVLDIPNARSAHSQPTPRGGGIAIVIPISIACLYLWLVDGSLEGQVTLALVGAGGMIAVVGYVDDRIGLSAAVRFSAHVGAAGMAVLLLGYREVAASVFPGLPETAVLSIVVVAIVWALNLFNFMDGIDGIAASEATFVAGGAAVLASWGGAAGGLATTMAALAAACLGFLAWNWAPAKIFMGDVGSGFLGYTLAVLALVSIVEGVLEVWTWLILTSLFVADATVTLLRRLMRGERWYAAHRSHAYQYLARRWNSHGRVTTVFVFLNLCVIFPLAAWSVTSPDVAPIITAGTLSAAGLMALVTGAGRREGALAPQ